MPSCRQPGAALVAAPTHQEQVGEGHAQLLPAHKALLQTLQGWVRWGGWVGREWVSGGVLYSGQQQVAFPTFFNAPLPTRSHPLPPTPKTPHLHLLLDAGGRKGEMPQLAAPAQGLKKQRAHTAGGGGLEAAELLRWQRAGQDGRPGVGMHGQEHHPTTQNGSTPVWHFEVLAAAGAATGSGCGWGSCSACAAGALAAAGGRRHLCCLHCCCC